jgi:hypothetical protein
MNLDLYGRETELLERGTRESSRTQPRHLLEEQRKILREVALTYRRARRAGKGQNEAVDAAIAHIGD